MNNSFVVKGNVCQTKVPKKLDLHENAYVVCVDGVSRGVFDSAYLPGVQLHARRCRRP